MAESKNVTNPEEAIKLVKDKMDTIKLGKSEYFNVAATGLMMKAMRDMMTTGTFQKISIKEV